MNQSSGSVVYRKPASDGDIAAYARVLAHSFGRPETESQGWLTHYDRSSFRLMAKGDEVLAGMILFEKGQFWGGRSVSMVGVGAVGVMPQARGHALASRMMVESLREMRERGFALSTLYPATQKLYRSVGYEQSGHRFEVRLPLNRIDVRERGSEVRPLVEADTAGVRALYRECAAAHAGNLDRGTINWGRIERPPPGRTDPSRGFVVIEHEESGSANPPPGPLPLGGGGRIAGYIYLTQSVVDWGKHEVHVQDMMAATPTAGRRLWSFLAGYGTVGTDMVWHAGPSHPMLMLLGEQPYRITIKHHWMNRIVHVEKALTLRGYPAGLNVRLLIRVRDDVLPENTGTYEVVIEDGKNSVARRIGDDPAHGVIEVDACGLACLYTGFASASTLRQVGIVLGDDAAVRAADAAFAGPTPWMTDMF